MNKLLAPLHITECPRDAMQGIVDFIPTAEKIKYINQLLKVRFDTIDFGSFVSAKAIPQLSDTAAVLGGLELDFSTSKLLAIVANLRGAAEACAFPQINYLGFPLSLSETFQQRNTHKSIVEAYPLISDIQNLCTQHHKQLVVYLSMGFGNPYGEAYSPNDVAIAVERLSTMGVTHILPSDTTGVANGESIRVLFQLLIPAFPHISFGAHLHTTALSAVEKLEAAYLVGCRRFDTSLGGIGGCPMAAEELTGNVATESLVALANHQQWNHQLDSAALAEATLMASELFAKYH